MIFLYLILYIYFLTIFCLKVNLYFAKFLINSSLIFMGLIIKTQLTSKGPLCVPTSSSKIIFFKIFKKFHKKICLKIFLPLTGELTLEDDLLL
jgi:hypothetical protein